MTQNNASKNLVISAIHENDKTNEIHFNKKINIRQKGKDESNKTFKSTQQLTNARFIEL